MFLPLNAFLAVFAEVNVVLRCFCSQTTVLLVVNTSWTINIINTEVLSFSAVCRIELFIIGSWYIAL
jgi:hypothetical protein